MSNGLKSNLLETIALMDDGRTKPEFHAITVKGERKALRLEQEYWTVLDSVANDTGSKPADIVHAVEKSHLNRGNLASAMRSFLTCWQTDQIAAMDDRLSEDNAKALINACPVPTFALNEKRQLLASNSAFLKFVRLRFSGGADARSEDVLRLQLDSTMEDLVGKLRSERNQPVETGFVIGMNEKRLRGRINAVLAPVWQRDIIIAYVLS